MTTTTVTHIPWPADYLPPGGYASDVWQPPPFAIIIGDPASLYVCSADAQDPETIWPAYHLGGIEDLGLAFTVVTGSTAPRVPLTLDTALIVAFLGAEHRRTACSPEPTMRHHHDEAGGLVNEVNLLTRENRHQAEDQSSLLKVVKAAAAASDAWREATVLLAAHGKEMARGTLARVHVVAYTEAAQRMTARATELDVALTALPPHLVERLLEENHG